MMRPCEIIGLREKSDCPDYGSSDCSINPEWGLCSMTLDHLRHVLSFKGRDCDSGPVRTFCGEPFPPCPLCGCECDVHDSGYGNGDIRCPGCGLVLPFGCGQRLETPCDAAAMWNRRAPCAPDGYAIVPKPRRALVAMAQSEVSASDGAFRISLESEIIRPAVEEWLRSMDKALLEEILSAAESAIEGADSR